MGHRGHHKTKRRKPQRGRSGSGRNSDARKTIPQKQRLEGSLGLVLIGFVLVIVVLFVIAKIMV